MPVAASTVRSAAVSAAPMPAAPAMRRKAPRSMPPAATRTGRRDATCQTSSAVSSTAAYACQLMSVMPAMRTGPVYAHTTPETSTPSVSAAIARNARRAAGCGAGRRSAPRTMRAFGASSTTMAYPATAWARNTSCPPTEPPSSPASPVRRAAGTRTPSAPFVREDCMPHATAIQVP